MTFNLDIWRAGSSSNQMKYDYNISCQTATWHKTNRFKIIKHGIQDRQIQRNRTVLNCYIKVVGSSPDMILCVFGVRCKTCGLL